MTAAKVMGEVMAWMELCEARSNDKKVPHKIPQTSAY
jgi:hypothetical protein